MKKLAVNLGETFFGGESSLAKPEGVGLLVSNVLKAALSLAGIILLVYLIIGGIGIMAGASQDNPEQAAKGKKRLQLVRSLASLLSLPLTG